MAKTNESFSFVLLLEGFNEITAAIEDALAEAGCTDAVLGIRNGVPYLDFDREASSAEQAVLSAIGDVEAADVGARVVRVEPDDIVSQAEIARRTGRTRETIRLWIEGERGPGAFPRPYSGITSRSLLWRWVEVARWLVNSEKIVDFEIVTFAETIARVNGALDLRDHKDMYSSELQKLLEFSSREGRRST